MSIYAKSKIAFCFTTFIVLQAVRYASFSKNVSICHVRLRKSRRRKPRFRIIYRFHRRTPRLSRLPNLWRIISLQTGPENAWPGSPGTDGYDGLKVKNTQAIVSRTRLGISYSQIPYLLSFISLYNSINSLAITLAISVLAI